MHAEAASPSSAAPPSGARLVMHPTGGRSPLAWMGGKSRLADRIVQRLPEHETYCEVFAGAAWVLFRKPPSQVEILNDVN